MSGGESREQRRYQIDGQDLGYPTSFRDGSSLMGMFWVPSRALNPLIEHSGLRCAEVAPGRTLMALNCVHYTDTDCGTYEEIALSAFVDDPVAPGRVPNASTLIRIARGTVASFAWRLAVTTTLSRDAGLRMWGYPKTLGDLRFERSGPVASMSWHDDDALVLRFTAPAGGSRRSAPISPPVYSMLDGELHVGHLTQTYSGVGYHRKGALLELGEHPVADELRRLGLPRRPLMAVWNGHLEFSMSAPRPVGAGRRR